MTPDASVGSDLIVNNVTIIDPRTGGLHDGQSIIVKGERITQVRPSGAPLPRGTRVIDGTGKYVVPGLWDMHVHLEFWDFEDAFPLLVGNGVTGVRDMGSSYVDARALRARLAAGRPTVRVTLPGNVIDGDAPPELPHRIRVRTPEEARRAVQLQAERGGDFIKVGDGLDRPSYLAMAQESHAVGLPFVGHVPMNMTGAEAAKAGQRTIEHLTGLPDCDTCPELITAVSTYAAQRTWQVPTLVQIDTEVLTYSTGLDPAQQALAPETARQEWKKMREVSERFLPAREKRLTLFQSVLDYQKRMIGMMAAAGVPILAGTDLGVTGIIAGYSLHRELELLAEAGLTPLQVLRAATSEAAEAMGRSRDFGSVEAGKFADFLLLNSNPLQDIRALQDPHGVVAGGVAFVGAERRLLLESRRPVTANRSKPLALRHGGVANAGSADAGSTGAARETQGGELQASW